MVDECDDDFAHPFYDSWKDCWQIKQQRDDADAVSRRRAGWIQAVTCHRRRVSSWSRTMYRR